MRARLAAVPARPVAARRGMRARALRSTRMPDRCCRERCKALACQTGAAVRTQGEHHVKGLGPVVLVDGVRDRGAVLRLACGARIAVSTTARNSSAALNTSALNTCKDIVRPKLVQDARRRCHSGS